MEVVSIRPTRIELFAGSILITLFIVSAFPTALEYFIVNVLQRLIFALREIYFPMGVFLRMRMVTGLLRRLVEVLIRGSIITHGNEMGVFPVNESLLEVGFGQVGKIVFIPGKWAPPAYLGRLVGVPGFSFCLGQQIALFFVTVAQNFIRTSSSVVGIE